MSEDLENALVALVEAQLGARVTRVEPLAGGLGLRRFLRLHTDAEPARLIARIEAPEDPAGRPGQLPPEPSLEPLRTLLAEHGLPVAARLGGDTERGIDLLEDLGDRSLEAAAKDVTPSARAALYRAVVAWVPALQRIEAPAARVPAFARHMDETLIRYKADLFARYSLPLALGRPARTSETDAVRAAFDRIAEVARAAPQRLAHRDLQSQNVLVTTGGDGEPAPRMIDFQGALLAPPEYDLVSLLRDSYVELPSAEVKAHLDWVRPRLPDAPDAESFARRFALLTVSRKGKDHARFLYAAAERGDRRWLPHLPATVRALRTAAAEAASHEPELERLAELTAALPESADLAAGESSCAR